MNVISKLLISAQETQKLAANLAKLCVVSDVILLYGEVGAGKTTFARGFIQELVGDGEEIVSPTFTLVQVYIASGETQIYHCDFYRLKYAEELQELGLDEAFERAITLIEWGELIENTLPDALRITLTISGDVRNIELKGSGKWQKLLNNL
jgi:tRNA threonylcarbamoyladenosine biosynthesis protein TsaE